MSVSKNQLSEVLLNSTILDQEFIDQIVESVSTGLSDCNHISVASTNDENGNKQLTYCLLNDLSQSVNNDDIFITIHKDGSAKVVNMTGAINEVHDDETKVLKVCCNLLMMKHSAIANVQTFKKLNKKMEELRKAGKSSGPYLYSQAMKKAKKAGMSYAY